jgi:SAM-dependent methyltransferase
MRIHLGKIERFYKSDLGKQAYRAVSSCLQSLLDSAGTKQKTCVASAASFAYMPQLEEMKRLALQVFHEQDSWPIEGKGHYIVADRYHWPYRAEESDFIVMIHDLEFAEEPEQYLREAWRVLKGEGRLIIAFPNRSGKWARYDNTPFGLGYPHTLDQMEKLLAGAHFAIDKIDQCLFHPPANPQSYIGRIWREIIEKVGLYCLFQPGIYVICASKHIYAPTKGLGATAAAKAKQALFPKPTTSVNNYKR